VLRRDASTPFRPRLRPRRNSAQHDLDFETALRKRLARHIFRQPDQQAETGRALQKEKSQTFWLTHISVFATYHAIMIRECVHCIPES
jgi:hypothetical protein